MKANVKRKLNYDFDEDELESNSRHTRINTVRKIQKLKRQAELQQARLNKQIVRGTK